MTRVTFEPSGRGDSLSDGNRRQLFSPGRWLTRSLYASESIDQQTTAERALPKMHKLLIVNDAGSDSSLLVKRLTRLGFSCSFSRSFEEAKSRLSTEDFDVVLSKLRINGGTAYELRPLLTGRSSSLFYSLSVEENCWWIPGVRGGRECLGEAALRPEDFFKVLVKISLPAPGEDGFGAAPSSN